MSIRNNILANVAGRVWVALMNFAFVPVYLRCLGAEGYGLIGVFATMMSIFTVLDLGFGATVKRELARLGGTPDGLSEARTLLRTLEAV